MADYERYLDKIEYSSNQKGVAYVDKSGVTPQTKKVLKVPSTENSETVNSLHIENDVSSINNMSVSELIKTYVR